MSDAAPAFTDYQIRIMRYVAAGLTDKEIARKLGNATDTVTTLLTRLRRKVGARNRAQLATYATNAGLLKPKQLTNQSTGAPS